MFDKFYAEMRRFVPEQARILSCQFRGDPNSDIYGKWRARVLNQPSAVDDGANVYLCVSAMQRNEAGEFRRRKENFAGGLLLMIDDIGTGAGAKFPLSIIDPLPPTALVETSPDNYQAIYMFDGLVTDIELFDALISSFIEQQFLAADTGMAGVNRVFRPPIGVNGKPKHARDGRLWRVRLASWQPQNRYSVARIAEAFGLNLVKKVSRPIDENLIAGAKADRIRAFIETRSALRSAAMIKNEEPDRSGWMQIRCPWIDDHTDRADTGAAIRLPADDNGWHGAFRCHHGHCQDNNWRSVTEWLAASQADVLSMVNHTALDFDDYSF